MHRIKGFQDIGFPTTFFQAQNIAKLFGEHQLTHYYDLLFFQIHSFLFLQTWCIPGTFLFNLLGGALFGMMVGFPICLLCNTLGAYFCFCLSKYFAKDLIDKHLIDRKNQIKNHLSNHKQDLLFYMISLRIFPGSPNWLMNITFPHIGISQIKFVLSILVGLTPWNFLVCQAGVIISSFKSKDEIFKPQTYIGLMALAIGISVLSFFKSKYKQKVL